MLGVLRSHANENICVYVDVNCALSVCVYVYLMRIGRVNHVCNAKYANNVVA